MTEHEIIIADSIPEQEYQKVFYKALDYAILSLPFTIDRMALKNTERQIANITKGKLAEGLLCFFFKHNSIRADFASCSTPFYQTDKRDFLLNGCEWDLKNNFIYHAGNVLTDYNYTDVPALVPNRHPGDQWAKRQKKNFEQSRGVNFLFTFLKGADLERGERGEPFFTLHLDDVQKSILAKMCAKYRGTAQDDKPFEENSFVDYFYKYKPLRDILVIREKPALVITAFADHSHWPLFKDTNRADFLNGILMTKIKNATCPIKKLPSFLSLFPRLKSGLYFGSRKNVE